MNGDPSLYFSLATAIATALGASISLGLVSPKGKNARERGSAAAVLCVAVLGLAAALIAIGKGHSTTWLTRLMFIGLLLPGLNALHGGLDRLLRRRRNVNLVFAGLALATLGLLAAASPTFFAQLFDPHDIDAEREGAIRGTGYDNPGPFFQCAAPDSCGGPKYVAWNIYTNNPAVGDERPFMSASHSPIASYDPTSDDQRVELVADVLEVEPGQEITVRVYYNNGAYLPANADGTPDPDSVTRTARALITVPAGPSAGLDLRAYLYADNAKPKTVSDAVAIVSDQPIRLKFVPGSASLSNHAFSHGLRLPNKVVAPVSALNGNMAALGTPLGYSQLDGRIAGEFDQAGYVTARFRVT